MAGHDVHSMETFINLDLDRFGNHQITVVHNNSSLESASISNNCSELVKWVSKIALLQCQKLIRSNLWEKPLSICDELTLNSTPLWRNKTCLSYCCLLCWMLLEASSLRIILWQLRCIVRNSLIKQWQSNMSSNVFSKQHYIKNRNNLTSNKNNLSLLLRKQTYLYSNLSK